MTKRIGTFIGPMLRAVQAARAFDEFEHMSDTELARRGLTRQDVPQALARTMGWID